MDNANKKRAVKLGEPFGTACHKLRKSILFNLLIQLKQNICYRCKKEILNLTDLSIEHKKPWLNSDNPKFDFYDLNNIAFSHLSCNVADADRSFTKKKEYRENQSKVTSSEFIGPEGTAWCSRCRNFWSIDLFTKNKRTRSKTEPYCKPCRKIRRSVTSNPGSVA